VPLGAGFAPAAHTEEVAFEPLAEARLRDEHVVQVGMIREWSRRFLFTNGGGGLVSRGRVRIRFTLIHGGYLQVGLNLASPGSVPPSRRYPQVECSRSEVW
jgi:hypothetical protein